MGEALYLGEDNDVDLIGALGVKHNTTVMVVGGGGKTAVIKELARESWERGWPALMTTTTRVLASEFSGSPVVYMDSDPRSAAAAVRRLWDRGQTPLLVGGDLPESGKYTGVAPEELDRLKNYLGGGCFFVEADGARNCPLKVPRPHEPVLGRADLVLGVVGADVFGRLLDEEVCYNSAAARRLLGAADEPVILTPERVARILLDTGGGRKGVPEGGPFRILINKAEGYLRSREAFRLKSVLENAGVPAVVASVWQKTILTRRPPVVSVVILAAGMSRRMGTGKQMLACGDRRFLEAAVRLYQPFGPVLVVLGHDAAKIRNCLDLGEADTVVNERYREGMSTSLRLCVQKAMDQGAEAILLAFCDMPHLRAETVDRILWGASLHPDRMVIPVYEGKDGHPVVFPLRFLTELLAIEGDRGARGLVHSRPEDVVRLPVEDRAVTEDIDEMDTYRVVSEREGWDQR